VNIDHFSKYTVSPAKTHRLVPGGGLVAFPNEEIQQGEEQQDAQAIEDHFPTAFSPRTGFVVRFGYASGGAAEAEEAVATLPAAIGINEEQAPQPFLHPLTVGAPDGVAMAFRTDARRQFLIPFAEKSGGEGRGQTAHPRFRGSVAEFAL
jgi:hypothetical protein